jgi:hypothetical protein
MIRTAALIVACLAVGCGLGFLVATRWGMSPTPPVGPDRSASPRSSPGLVHDADPNSADLLATRVAAPDGPPESLAAALAAIPEPSVENGEGRFTGHVRTSDGEPVADVLIRAVPKHTFRSDRDPGAEEAGDLERVVLDTVRSFRWRRASTQEARTGPRGAYELSGLVPTWRYNVSAEAEGWVCRTAPGSRGQDRLPGSTIDFVATATVALPVTVVFRDGGEPSFAMVECRASSVSQVHAWSPQRRDLSLEPQEYTLRAVSGNENEYASEWVKTVLSAGVQAEPVTLVLASRPGILGRARFPKGEEPASAYVRIIKFEGDQPPPVSNLLGSSTSDLVLSPQVGFAFSFKDLEPGSYLVGAGYGSRKILVAAPVRVEDETVMLDLEVPPLEPGACVVLRVIAPDGRLTTDVFVTTSFSTPSRSSPGGSITAMIKRPDDTIWVLHEPDANMEGAAGLRCFLTVMSKKYGQREVEYFPGDRAEVTVEFGEPATLDVTVDGYAGSRYEGTVVLMVVRVDQVSVRSHIMSSIDPALDPSGQQSFGPLEPGDYSLQLRLDRYRNNAWVIAEVPVSVRPGRNAARLPMPALHGLKLVVQDLAGAMVELSSIRPQDAWGSRTLEVDKDGLAAFDDLLEGEYRVKVTVAGVVQGAMPVSVPAQAKVLFKPGQ